MSGATLVALLTCHNRRDQTLACLRALAAATAAAPSAVLRVVVVDAASTDGTAEAVERQHPEARVVRATADTFWNGGMRIAFEHAREENADHYLWLNDDTLLDPDALVRLLATSDEVRRRTGRPAVVCGTTRDPESGTPTYGGLERPSRWRPMSFRLVPPGDRSRQVQTMNGNCVLVPREVAHAVGNLSPEFTHHLGDLDYGLRVCARGYEVWLAPGTVGTCARNPVSGRSLRAEVDHLLRSPKGLPPAEWRVFARRWAGPAWPFYFVSPYVRRIARRILPRGR